MRLKQVLLIAFLALCISAAAAGQASAAKVHLFQETFGSAAQQSFAEPNGLVVEQDSGNLLVIDAGAQTVSRFNPDGTPANFSALGSNVIDAKGPIDGTPEEGFSFGPVAGKQQIAVDNSGGPTDGDIYVTQWSKNLAYIFAPDGTYLGQVTGAGAPFTGVFPLGVAVDPSGNVFLSGLTGNQIFKEPRALTRSPTRTSHPSRARWKVPATSPREQARAREHCS